MTDAERRIGGFVKKYNFSHNRIVFGKRLAFLGIMVILMFSLSGCTVDDFLDSSIGQKMIRLMIGEDWEESESSGEGSDFPMIEVPVYKKQEDVPDTKETEEPVLGEAESAGEEPETAPDEEEEPIAETMSEAEMEQNCEGMIRYGYSKLADADRTLYRDIYDTLMNHKSGKKLSSKSEDQIDRVFQVVMNDHPEIYYVSGYTINKYLLGGRITSIEFTGKYTHSKENCEEYGPRIRNYRNQCLADAPDTGDDYDRVKYVYEYIVENTDYDLRAAENQNILSVFIYGKSVCNGYAKAAQYLLNEMGIPCLLVSGTVKNGESHAWNLVCVNGQWCVLDVTWGDASYMTNAPEMEPGINYDYLCANDEINDRTHRTNAKIPLPACRSLDAYYYVREGTYITGIDEEQLGTLFRRAYENGEDRITLKCDSYDNYEKLQRYLIDEEHIFSLMKHSGNQINYARLPDGWGMIFYL